MPRKLSNWLTAYGEYTKGNESPESFHIWAGLATIAAAAQRKVCLDLKHFKVYTNLLVLLVGPSGEVRKSTALGFARGIAKELEDWGYKLEIAPKKLSGASLISRMSRIQNPEHQSLTVYAGELGTLLGAQSTDVTDMVTDLHDCEIDFDKELVSRAAEKITAPWLNVIGATTPVWLADNLPKTAIEGGFLSRTILVYEGESDKRIALPDMSAAQEAMRKPLLNDLCEVAQVRGNFVLTPGAKEMYTAWYNNKDNFRVIDPRLKTYAARKNIHALKVAMLLSLAEGNSLLIDEGHIQLAIDILTTIEPAMPMALAGVGKNPFALEYESIRRQIQLARRVSYKDLISLNISRMERPVIDSILATLATEGKIRNAGAHYEWAA